MFQSVIFDMDGVISDSEPLHHVAERRLLAPYGIQISQAKLETFTGMGLHAMLDRFKEEFNIPDSVQALAAQHNQNLLEIFREQVTPIPHALDLIQTLFNAGLILAVGSSSNAKLIQLVLEKFEILPYFKTVVSGQDVPNGKPHPDIFLEVFRRLQINPQDCIVIEDSRNGVTAAKAAGMTCIGFTSPNSPNQDLSQADYLVSHLSEISMELLNTLFSAREF